MTCMQVCMLDPMQAVQMSISLYMMQYFLASLNMHSVIRSDHQSDQATAYANSFCSS
jgi:hypothetical protein